VLCIGEVMAQVVPVDGERFARSQSFAVSAAGAEFNVAVGLTQLGSPAELLTRLGDDAVGDRLLRQIDLAGVGTALVRRQAGARTGLFVKDPRPDGSTVGYYRDRSAASRLSIGDVDAALAPRPPVVHVSGVTPALSASCLDATRHALHAGRRAGAVTSFDVNFRPRLWPSRAAAAATLAELANASEVVFVGLDEAVALWEVQAPADVRRVLGGPSVLVVKDGPRDARSHSRDGWSVEPALPVDVVEPVGAGDAFAAGWLEGCLRGLPMPARLRLGHQLAAASLRSVTDHARAPLDAETLVRRAVSGTVEPGRTPHQLPAEP
jgi:2-dehydro-3-deoxygluconokinase